MTSPRPPTDISECMCPEPEAQCRFFRLNLFSLCQPWWAGVSIVVREGCLGRQCFLFANLFFSDANFAEDFCPLVASSREGWGLWRQFIPVAAYTYVAVRVSRWWFTREEGGHGLPQAEISSLQVSCKGSGAFTPRSSAEPSLLRAFPVRGRPGIGKSSNSPGELGAEGPADSSSRRNCIFKMCMYKPGSFRGGDLGEQPGGQ